ncbi:MAG TPA: hypothetical protein VJL35_13220 [Gemmatimonadaceae bacterium]|nr:hypothetical protein [Gemmatimonadaceae bacterium]
MSNLRRYLLWQLRDFVRDRGYAVLIVGFLLGFTVVGPVRGMGRTIDANLARTMLIMILTQVGFILPFITLNGIVSTDRKMGYYRFLFSKPVSIPAYYVQLFIVYFIGFLAATLILLGAFSIFAHPVHPFRPLLYCALVYLSLAGIAFLISSLFRYDWPILAGVFLGSALLHSMWQGYEGWRRMILAVLPPVYKLTGLLQPILTRGEVDTNDILWLLGYSALCFAAGLVVLQKRPFG